MKKFELKCERIDENNTALLFDDDQLQNIEELYLSGSKLCYFNLDSFVGLKKLLIRGNISDGFNFDIFKNISTQLSLICIIIDKLDYDSILKLFAHDFSNVQILDIRNCNIKILEKKFIEKFPRLIKFCMSNCNLEMIEDGVFSNFKELVRLDMRKNLLKRLYKRDFSNLVNLNFFYMCKNRIEFIEDGIFSHMKHLKYVDLSDNQLVIHNLKPFKGQYLDKLKLCIVNNQILF